LSKVGYSLRLVHTPKGVLHFKSDCGLLDSETIFSTSLLANSKCFEGYKIIEAPQGEEAAANLIRYNDHVFLRAGFPKTKALLQASGYRVKTLAVEEAAKVDGGLSCMSLRFSL
jgi:dimethylargininase